jgi:hypothetical protein
MSDFIIEALLEKWDDVDFKAFALTYAGYADNNLRYEEYDAIIDVVGEKKAQFAKKLMEKLNKTQRTELLLRFRPKFFPTNVEVDKLLADMKQIFLADGRFCIMEQSALAFLEQVMKK